MATYTILNTQFTVYKNAETGKKLAKCNYCGVMMKYHHSTTSLSYHLKCKHSIGNSVASKRKGIKAAKPSAPTKPEPTCYPKQLDDADGQQLQPLKDNLIEHLALWIVKDIRPLDIVEDEGLGDLLITASKSKSHRMPSITTMKSHLENIYQNQYQQLKQSLALSTYVSLSSDHMTIGGDDFTFIRCHHISPNWNAKTALLGVKTSRSKFTTDEDAMTLSNQWEKDCAERATHIVYNVVQPTNDHHNQFEHTPCFANILWLCIEKTMTSCPMERSLVDSLVEYYSECEGEDNTLQKLNPLASDEDICTLWRRVYAITDYLVKQKGDATNHPSAQEWAELHKLLEPLENAIRVLGSNNYTTASSILPLIAYLRKCMTIKNTDNLYSKSFKTSFMKELELRIQTIVKSKELALAVCLDIRYKRLLSIPSEKREAVWETLKSAVQEEIDSGSKSTEESAAAKKPRTSLLSLAGDDNDEVEEEEGCIPEFEMYKHIPQVSDDDQCPLQWWSQYASTYPILGELAKRYLSIPATSVKCELLFSDGRKKLKGKISALANEDINLVLCLSDWLNNVF